MSDDSDWGSDDEGEPVNELLADFLPPPPPSTNVTLASTPAVAQPAAAEQKIQEPEDTDTDPPR